MNEYETRTWFVAVLVTVALLGLFVYWLIEQVHRRWDNETTWHKGKLDNLNDQVSGVRIRLERHDEDAQLDADKAKKERRAMHEENKGMKLTIMQWMREALDYLKGAK